MDDFFLGHLAVGWDLGLFHHFAQGVVLITQLIDLDGEFIPCWFDEGFGIGLDPLHLLPNGLVLPLEVFECPEGAIDVVFVLIFVDGEGDVGMFLLA